MRLSGLQRQVVQLYRAVLRAARAKPEPLRAQVQVAAAAEMRRNAGVDKKDLVRIEYLLRRGANQLTLLQPPNQRHHVIGAQLQRLMASPVIELAGRRVQLAWTPRLMGGCPAGRVDLTPYVVRLRSPFGTSHSSSSVRLNALVRVSVGVAAGCAEVGLPPKKPGCYEADYGDCVALMGMYCDRLTAVLGPYAFCTRDGVAQPAADGPPAVWDPALADPWAALPPDVRPPLAAEGRPPDASGQLCQLLLNTLDAACAADDQPIWRPLACGLETSILCCWAHLRAEPLHKLLGLPRPQQPSRQSFYTAALNEDIGAIVSAAQFGAAYTPLLKIKLDADLDKAGRILDALATALPPPQAGGASGPAQLGLPPGRDWAVDANSCWTPAEALRFIREVARPHLTRIFMLEQPFPMDLVREPRPASREPEGLAYQLEGWAAVRAAAEAEGVLVYADEAVRGEADVVALRPYVHGVNLKMEKAGGPRGLLAAAHVARSAGLRVWLGCMVGSALNSTATAHLLALAGACDLDGDLLVDGSAGGPADLHLSGGFTWGPGGAIILPDVAGHGVTVDEE